MGENEYKRALGRLAGAIIDAEARVRDAGLNGTTMMQVRASERLDDLRFAFAVASGTAVNGMHFNNDLKKAKELYQSWAKELGR